eukprot:429014-Pyramimonas_sp.AAC.1
MMKATRAAISEAVDPAKDSVRDLTDRARQLELQQSNAMTKRHLQLLNSMDPSNLQIASVISD